MRRISLFVVAALICCSLPAGVWAQGCLPGLPSFSGWSCAPPSKANCSVDGKLGYLGYNQGLVFDRSTTGPPNPGGADTVRFQYPIQGFWVGASAAGSGPGRGFAAYDPGEGLCLSLAASWLLPSNNDATETATFTPVGIRTWTPNIQWYTLEASASRCTVGNFSLIGGFRYDSFSTNFSSPSPVADYTNSRPADEALLSLTSYIPYVGAVTKWGAVEVGVLGFPWVWGTMASAETIGAIGVRYEATGNYRNSYFAETWAAFGGQLGIANLSAFATYTVLHATGDCDFSRNVIGAAGLTASNVFGFDRQNWIAGGKAVIGFNSPL